MKPINKQKGFTLIELMIVVAIIGILAAVAIPQFSSYRQKAFNSACQSDIRTLKLTQEAFYSDNQNYGVTAASGTGAGAATLGTPTVIANSNGTTTGVVADANAAHAVATVAPSNKVSITSDTDATGASMTMECGHEQGNRTFAMDSDATALYFAPKDAGQALAATDFAPSLDNDDVNGTNSVSVGGGAYAPL